MPRPRGEAGPTGATQEARRHGKKPPKPPPPAQAYKPPPPTVTAPYAPTRKGKRAEQRAKAVRRARRIERKSLRRSLHLIESNEAPEVAIERARYGKEPPKKLKRTYPGAYRIAKREQSETLHPEGLKEDPLAEFVIGTAATAGLGAGAKALGAAGKAGVEAIGAKLASKEASVGEQAVEKGLRAATKRTAGRVKTAPRSAARGVKARATSKVERVKATPKRIKTAPSRAKKAASTSEGRRAAAKGGLRTARRHPVRTGVPVAAASPVPLPGELDKRARAFVKGTAAAFTHPGKVAETTEKGAIGFLTAPVAIAGAGIKSVEKGSPTPLVETTKGFVYQPAVPKSKGGTGQPGGLVGMAENLASGDPKRVEQATLEETGALPFIPVPHFLRRAKRSDTYTGIREAVRGKAEARRAKGRDAAMAQERELIEAGQKVPKKLAKKVKKKQSIEDRSRPGEAYVSRHAGSFIEKQRSRHSVSRQVSRMMRKGENAGRLASKDIIKAIRKSKGTEGKLRLKNQEMNHADSLRILERYGIPHDQAVATGLVQVLHNSYPKNEYGDVSAAGTLDRHATQYILDNPSLFSDKQVLEARQHFHTRSEENGLSERNRLQAQAHLVNLLEPHKPAILFPEERVTPEALKVLPKRDKPWSRSEALSYAKELRQIKGPDRAKALEKAQALTNGKHTGALDKLMKPPEHGGAEGGVSTTQADAYTPQMVKDFAKEVRTRRKPHGMVEPAAYVADVVPSGLHGAEKGPGVVGGIPLRKIWPNSGKAFKSGNALADFEHTVHKSIEAPHQRRALAEGLTRVFGNASREVNGKRSLTASEAARAINRHEAPPGVLFMRPQLLTNALKGPHALNPEDFHALINEEIGNAQKAAMAKGEEIRNQLEAGKHIKGEKVVPMNAADIHELMGHFEDLGRVTKAFSRASNFSTRTILNSIAFPLVQIAQEGSPLAAALGRNIVHVPSAIMHLKEIAKLPIEQQAEIKAVVGSSAGILGAPSRAALRSEGVLNPIKASAPLPAWRHVLNVINGNVVNHIDRERAGKFREVAAMARVHGDLKRAERGFNRWRKGANNLFQAEQEAVKAMKGMNHAEEIAYVTSHPSLGDKLIQANDAMAGNWNSFTTFEKHYAPFTLFYSFQRFSVLWQLYHFPFDHPVVASALALSGSVNAQKLDKAAKEKGTAITNPLEYAFPVVDEGGGKQSVLPVGARTATGLSTIQQSLISGKPSQLIGEATPPAAITIAALSGRDPFTGRPLEENGWKYAAKQFLSLSPELRLATLNKLGEGQSPLGKAYAAQDPYKLYRSVVDPTQGQTMGQFTKTLKLSQKVAEKYDKEGIVPWYGENPLYQKIRYGKNAQEGNVKAVKRELAELVKKIHATEGAGNYVQKREERFYPSEKEAPEWIANLIDETVQNAYLTGPSYKQPKKKGHPSGGSIGGIGGESIGGIGGHPIGGGIGGHPIGGGIGGHPIGARP